MFDSVCQDHDWHCVKIFPATLWSPSLITRLVQTNKDMLTHTHKQLRCLISVAKW